MQTLAAAGELQRELTYDGLQAAEAKGNKGGRRPAITAEKANAVRTAYLDGRTIAALSRERGVSRGAIRTAVADLMPEHTAADHEDTPAPELPVTLDMPGKVADFLLASELEPAERAALDHGVTDMPRPGLHPARQRRPLGAPRAPRPLPTPRRHPGCPGDPGTAQGLPRVREARPRPHEYSRTVINGFA